MKSKSFNSIVRRRQLDEFSHMLPEAVKELLDLEESTPEIVKVIVNMLVKENQYGEWEMGAITKLKKFLRDCAISDSEDQPKQSLPEGTVIRGLRPDGTVVDTERIAANAIVRQVMSTLYPGGQVGARECPESWL
jgi:hypothetical protein